MKSLLRTLAASAKPNPTRFSSGLVPHRDLFTLSHLSSLLPQYPETEKYHEQIVLPYEPKELYDVVADVESYPHFVPFCTASRFLHAPIEESTGHIKVAAELTVGFLHFRESYTSNVTCTPYKSVKAIASSSTPLFKTLSTVWRFQLSTIPSSSLPQITTQTLVTLDLEYAFSNPVYASVSSKFFGEVSQLMIKAFEERCSEIYGHKRR